MKHLKTILIFGIITSNFLTAQTNGNLLFKSAFDYNVIVDKTVSWNHHLSGTDQTTNYTFPNDLPGDNPEHFFNYVVGDMDHYYEYANAEIVNTTGFDGNATNALFIEFIKDDPTFISYSRVQYAMYGDANSMNPVDRLNQGYIKYKLKTHLDHTDTLSDWRIPVEWKDVDDDGFRMGLYIYDTNTTTPYWLVKGQFMVNGELGADVWEYSNFTIPVIEDEWFDLEIYWNANPDPSLGKLKIAINGEILFDITETTKDPNQPDKVFYFMPFKVYGTVGYSWITDFEYWDNPPITSILNEIYLHTDSLIKPNYNLYPNPTDNYLHMDIDELGVTYQIINSIGKIIQKGIIKNKTINISSLKKGVYNIKSFHKNKKPISNAKFIKY